MYNVHIYYVQFRTFLVLLFGPRAGQLALTFHVGNR
jgi:hypothetical protein